MKKIYHKERRGLRIKETEMNGNNKKHMFRLGIKLDIQN